MGDTVVSVVRLAMSGPIDDESHRQPVIPLSTRQDEQSSA